jgi:hypothetical protein
MSITKSCKAACNSTYSCLRKGTETSAGVQGIHSHHLQTHLVKQCVLVDKQYEVVTLMS